MSSRSILFRDRPIPSTDRLLVLWRRGDVALSPLENAALVCGNLWAFIAAVEASWQEMAHLAAGGTPAPGVRRPDHEVVRAIDDEITWYLGNQPDTVTLIEDDSPVATVGEMVSRLAVLAVPLLSWESGPRQCPIYPPFRALGDEYDTLTNDLVSRARRQPRRRADGEPPVPEPLRIGLTAVTPRMWRRTAVTAPEPTTDTGANPDPDHPRESAGSHRPARPHPTEHRK